ncbi:DMT family transporter [Anaerospora hongkongensis]|uniref:DMT family transporter n=1 Tax=Anaerospora hongkongensis TaxID=244830 RepID=UPI00289CEE75|nr:DMT family transporter [Anaerospora hongkongensis]
MKNWQIWMLLVLCNLFWAGNYVFGKYVITEITPLWITFSRWVLALFFLFPIAYYFEKLEWKTIRQDWLLLTCMGGLGIIGYNLLLYSALAYTTATNAALVSALNPGIIVIVSVFLTGERISKLQAAGFLVSLAGVLIILTNGKVAHLLQANYNQGDLLMLAAVFVWTAYSLISKKLQTPPITATAVSSAIAVIMMMPFAASQGINFAAIKPLALGGIIYIILFPSVCSFVFWNLSVKAVGASKCGVFLNLVPVFTAIISVMLGENITLAQLFGGLAVFLGVYLTTGLLDKWFARTDKPAGEPIGKS